MEYLGKDPWGEAPYALHAVVGRNQQAPVVFHGGGWGRLLALSSGQSTQILSLWCLSKVSNEEPLTMGKLACPHQPNAEPLPESVQKFLLLGWVVNGLLAHLYACLFSMVFARPSFERSGREGGRETFGRFTNSLHWTMECMIFRRERPHGPMRPRERCRQRTMLLTIGIGTVDSQKLQIKARSKSNKFISTT